MARWDRGLQIMPSKLLLSRNKALDFFRNPDFCPKAPDFYVPAVNSNLKCHVRAKPMQVKSSPSVGVWPTGHILDSSFTELPCPIGSCPCLVQHLVAPHSP